MGAALGGAAPARCGRGMVTVELAVGILLAALVTAGLTSAVTLGATHSAATAAAHQIALHTARGDSASVAKARQEVPADAQVRVDAGPDGVEVTVTVRRQLPVVGGITMDTRAWARWEPGVGP